MTTDQFRAFDALHFARARDRDFLGVASLDRCAWRDNRSPEFIPDGEHVWRVWMDAAHVFIARDQAAIIGAILAFPTRSGALCVHKVMVDQAWRGRGIGTRLFQLLLAEVDRDGAAACYLTVDPTNVAALKLYEKWGFTERQFVAGYYRPDEDRYVLTRPAAWRGTAN